MSDAPAVSTHTLVPCAACGNQISSAADQCPRCGSQVILPTPRPMPCAACGTQLTDVMLSCPSCGHPVPKSPGGAATGATPPGVPRGPVAGVDTGAFAPVPPTGGGPSPELAAIADRKHREILAAAIIGTVAMTILLVGLAITWTVKRSSESLPGWTPPAAPQQQQLPTGPDVTRASCTTTGCSEKQLCGISGRCLTRCSAGWWYNGWHRGYDDSQYCSKCANRPADVCPPECQVQSGSCCEPGFYLSTYDGRCWPCQGQLPNDCPAICNGTCLGL